MNFYKCTFLLFVLAILGNTSASSFSHSAKEIDMILDSVMNKPKKEIFKVFHNLHKKTYNLNSEEGLKRYKIFKANMKWNQEKNAESGKQIYGITPFMDMTDEEFKKSYLMESVEIEKHIGQKGNKIYKNSFVRTTNETTPQIDWRPLYEGNPCKDQGKCGSCWSFSSNAAIEGNFRKDFGEAKDLSVQYLVDCDLQDHGCDG